MIKLEAERTIAAPRDRCFDLVRSVEAHAAAVPGIRARAEAGKTRGLLCLGAHVRWSAVYAEIRFYQTVRVSELDWPIRYREVNEGGPFALFRHDYLFVEMEPGRTMVRDTFRFESPLHPLSHWLDRWILAPLLRKALETRMDSLKTWAEGREWRRFLSEEAVV